MRSRRKLKGSNKKAAKKIAFRVEETTITAVHRAFRARKLTATELVSRYFERIRAYNGLCVRGDVDAATGLQLGDITPIPNCAQRLRRPDLQSLRYDEDSRRIERRLGRSGGSQPRHVRAGHGYLRLGALSVILLQPGRPGRDPGAGEP